MIYFALILLLSLLVSMFQSSFFQQFLIYYIKKQSQPHWFYCVICQKVGGLGRTSNEEWNNWTISEMEK